MDATDTDLAALTDHAFDTEIDVWGEIQPGSMNASMDASMENLFHESSLSAQFSYAVDDYEEMYIDKISSMLTIPVDSVINKALNISTRRMSKLQTLAHMQSSKACAILLQTAAQKRSDVPDVKRECKEVIFQIPVIDNLPASTSWFLVFGNLYVTTLTWFNDDYKTYEADTVNINSNHFCFVASAELLHDILSGALFLTRAKMQRLYDMFYANMVPPVIAAHVVRDCPRGCIRDQLNLLALNPKNKVLRTQVSEMLDKCSYFQSIEPILRPLHEFTLKTACGSVIAGTGSRLQCYVDPMPAHNVPIFGQYFVENENDTCLCS